MKILDGKKLSEKIKEEVKKEVEKLKKEGIIPGLAVILVGNDPASQNL
jgi:methylenetetrahydrofolate dehydrogenase (NADP+)/methenyltetrahydrofolate cyclohydrolase